MQLMLPVLVISRSPGTVRSNGQNAVIGVLIVQFPPTSIPPTSVQVAADAWPGIPTARTRAAITTIASESFLVIFPMLLSMCSLLRSVRVSNTKAAFSQCADSVHVFLNLLLDCRSAPVVRPGCPSDAT